MVNFIYTFFLLSILAVTIFSIKKRSKATRDIELEKLFDFIDDLPPAERSYGNIYQYKDIEFKRRMSHCNKVCDRRLRGCLDILLSDKEINANGGKEIRNPFFPVNKKTGIRYADSQECK